MTAAVVHLFNHRGNGTAESTLKVKTALGRIFRGIVGLEGGVDVGMDSGELQLSGAADIEMGAIKGTVDSDGVFEGTIYGHGFKSVDLSSAIKGTVLEASPIKLNFDVNSSGIIDVTVGGDLKFLGLGLEYHTHVDIEQWARETKVFGSMWRRSDQSFKLEKYINRSQGW